MRFVHSVIAAVSLAGLAASSLPAMAGDLFGRGAAGSIKDDYYDPPPFSWTGFYIGAHAGLANGDTQGTPETLSIFGGGPGPIPGGIAAFFSTDYDLSGALYGGHIGYNFQAGALVFGIEGTLSGTSIGGDGPAGVGLIVSEREVDWLATVTGRLGYAMGRSLVYAKGGVAWGDVESSVRLGGITVLEGNETHVGWTVGAGYEYALSNNVTFRIEYAHIDLGSESHNLSYNGVFGGNPGDAVLGSDVDLKFDTLNIGVSFKFGGDRYVAPLK